MATPQAYEPAPTWAAPFTQDDQGNTTFNPVWLGWFLNQQQKLIPQTLQNPQTSITMGATNLFTALSGLAGVTIGGGTTGILGTDAAGATTFWIDPATGSVKLVGDITATTGHIGGFTIGADYIRDAADSFGLASTVTGGNDVRWWAGAAFASRATAPSRMYEDGSVYFGAGTFAGNIDTTGWVKATGGTTGGLGTATITAYPAAANTHAGDFWATGTGHGLLSTSGGSGNAGRFNAIGTGVAVHITGNTSAAAVQIVAGAGQNAITTTGAVGCGNINGTTIPSSATLVTSGGALGTPSSGTLTNCSGTAASLTAGHATALATARAINGHNFDGTAAITIGAADVNNNILLYGGAFTPLSTTIVAYAKVTLADGSGAAGIPLVAYP